MQEPSGTSRYQNRIIQYLESTASRHNTQWVCRFVTEHSEL